MSVPRSLELPEGVSKAFQVGPDDREIAMLSILARGPRRGHVLLVPGWTGSKEDFTPLLPLLADAGFDVDAYDQAGQYESDSADDYSLQRYARDALWLISIDAGRSHVLGHSFGGLVAQTAATLDPSSFASLSLLDTGPGALGDSTQRPLQMLVDAIGKVPMDQLHELREQGARRRPEIAAFLRERFLANDPVSLRAMTQLLIDAPDVIDEVAASGIPVWVGRGADDDAWPHEDQATMAKRLDTEIHVVPGAAHSPAVENPAGLAAAWLPFLLEHSTVDR